MTSETDILTPKAEFGKIQVDPAQNKLNDQLSESSSHVNHISNLKFIINQVEKLTICPPVHIYSITSAEKGMSAVDVSQNLSHLAYSFSHASEIRFLARKSLSDHIARKDFKSTWLNFSSARNRLTEAAKSEQKQSECLSSPQEFIIRHDDVSGLRFSSDDNLLLSCSLNGSIKIISTTTYCVLEHYDGFGSSIDIDVNTNTTQFVTANVLSLNPFHVAYLYNFERKTHIQDFSGHENSLKCVRFHPNGLYIATASSDGNIKLWSVQQSKEVRNFREEGMHPEKLTFSPDGKHIASTHNGCVKIWDISSGKKLKCLETSNPEPAMLNVCYSFDGRMLAVGGSDKRIHIWDIMSDESSEMKPNLLKSECLGKTIFSLKYNSNFFSCVTG